VILESSLCGHSSFEKFQCFVYCPDDVGGHCLLKGWLKLLMGHQALHGSLCPVTEKNIEDKINSNHQIKKLKSYRVSWLPSVRKFAIVLSNLLRPSLLREVITLSAPILWTCSYSSLAVVVLTMAFLWLKYNQYFNIPK